MKHVSVLAGVVLLYCAVLAAGQTDGPGTNGDGFLTGECRLCGSDHLELPVVYRTESTVAFDGCCSPLQDEGDCRQVTETPRTATFEGPLVVSGVEELCLELNELEIVEADPDVECCPAQCSCTDGFCTSFGGETVYAGACDARREGGCCGLSVCVFDKDLCLSMVDSKGDPCIWVGKGDEDLCLTTGFGPAEVDFFNRPCRAKNPTDTLLYRVSGSAPNPAGNGRALQCKS